MAGMKKMRIKDRIKAEDGQVLVLAPALILLGLLLVGLVIDVGNMYLTQYRMQAATDAAALASDQILANGDGTNTGEAVAAANRFMKLNGFPEVRYDLSNPSPANEIKLNAADYRVQLGFTQSVPTYFLSLFGMNHINVTVHSHAIDSSAFNYALCANQQLDLTGQNFTIRGNVQSNGDLRVSGNGSIDGRTGYVGVATLDTNEYNAGFGQTAARSSSIPMPVVDLSRFATEAKQGNQYYPSSQVLDAENVNFASHSVIYVNGDLVLNAGHYSGFGTLVATGSIYINGANFTQETAGQGWAALYAGKNIIVTNPNTAISGLLYAPNGTVDVEQNNLTVNGAIVANKIVLRGNHVSIYHQNRQGIKGFQGLATLVN